MADDPKKTAEDRKRINVNEDYELRQWAESLKVTPDALRQAVKEVGTSADAVRNHLAKKSP